MTTTHTITFTGLLCEFAGFVLFYKATRLGLRPDADAVRVRGMNHLAFGLVAGGFALEFFAAGMSLPP
jgi:hypothetical protein